MLLSFRTPRFEGASMSDTASNSFVSSETALSFPVAAAAISTMWKLSEEVIANASQNKHVPIAMACIVGLCFYVASEKPEGLKKKIPGVLAAIFNTAALAAAVIGISQAGPPAS